MTSEEVREKFINFWTEFPRNHKVVPNVPLVPDTTDTTLLFVNSGMFPLVRYLLGEPHPLGNRLCNIQRCLRTNYEELIEIGDNRHTSMFEMMGNWSLGAYSKEDQIKWLLELEVEQFGIDPHRLYVSVWKGDDYIPRDDEAIEIWMMAFRKYGIKAEFTEDITKIPENLRDGEIHKYRIFPYGKEKNWWQRGIAPGELGGPTTEIFYDTGKVEKKQEIYHINDDSGRFIEIGNSVFMDYRLNEKLQWESLKQKNIDFGGGLERTVMIVQKKDDIFETDIYEPILKRIEEISGKCYKDDGKENQNTASFRVIADHARAATFILADGVLPSNKDQGYILRGFIRRLIRFGRKIGIEKNFSAFVADAVINRMKNIYPHLEKRKDVILAELEREEEKFKKTLKNGMRELQKIKESGERMDGKKAFYIYQTFGFPLELTMSELNIAGEEAERIEEEYRKQDEAHRKKSRTSVTKKFKSGLGKKDAIYTKYHTATHLLLAALKKVLNKDIHQMGSNITEERIRFDFNYNKPLAAEQKQKIENWVNDAIEKELEVTSETMKKEEARKNGAETTFWDRYPDVITVYKIWDTQTKKIYSYEACNGPHVKNTRELKQLGRFKIIKEESCGSGIRRIKAIFSKT